MSLKGRSALSKEARIEREELKFPKYVKGLIPIDQSSYHHFRFSFVFLNQMGSRREKSEFFFTYFLAFVESFLVLLINMFEEHEQ